MNLFMTEKEKVWDPLRKKEVALTPEEQVRQWCISVLSQQMGVPMHLMMSEVGFRLGEKRLRADLVVYDRSARPVMVVECKRPGVTVDGDVLDQAIRYNMVLDVKYIMITNGTTTCICRRTENDGQRRYVFIDNVPSYNEMLCLQ